MVRHHTEVLKRMEQLEVERLYWQDQSDSSCDSFSVFTESKVIEDSSWLNSMRFMVDFEDEAMVFGNSGSPFILTGSRSVVGVHTGHSWISSTYFTRTSEIMNYLSKLKERKEKQKAQFQYSQLLKKAEEEKKKKQEMKIMESKMKSLVTISVPNQMDDREAIFRFYEIVCLKKEMDDSLNLNEARLRRL